MIQIDIITDAIGKASFCYSSTVWGIDTVIAVSAQVADTAIVIWDFPYPVELLAFNFSIREKDVTLFLVHLNRAQQLRLRN